MATCWGEETCGGETSGWAPCAAGTGGTGAPCSSGTRDHPGGHEEPPPGLGLTWPYPGVAGGRGLEAGASSEAGRDPLEAGADWDGRATVYAGGGPCPDLAP